MDGMKSGRLGSPMSRSDVEENNTAVRRGKDVDVETLGEKESSRCADEGAKENRKHKRDMDGKRIEMKEW
jgi:hypothetical protein